MSNLNPSYVSTVNNVTTAFSDRTAISLPDMMKNIITAFHAATIYGPRALQQATNSYSARFPASWTTSSSYHASGARLLGQTNPPARAFRDITIDDRIVTHLFIDELDANVRAIVPFQDMFAQEMGQAISQFDDQNCGVVAVLAARASATVSGADNGTIVTKANCNNNIGALNAAIWDVKNGMDEKKVSQMGRILALKPAQYNLISSSLNRPFFRELGGSGSFGGNVQVPDYAGFQEILMTLNMPQTNISSNPSGAQNTYSGDFSKTVAHAWTKGAYGTVYSTHSLSMGGGTQPAPTNPGETQAQNHPLEVRDVEIREAFGKLLIASLVTGHGILNPVCAAEIATP